MDALIYALGLALILSCFLDVRFKELERRFSFGLVRVLLLLPLLAGVYLYVSYNFQLQLVAPLFFVENVFSLIWLFLAFNLQHAISQKSSTPRVFYLFFLIAGASVVGTACYWFFIPPVAEIVDDYIIFPHYGQFYFSALFMLLTAFFMVWRLEMFWRALNSSERWMFKYLILGFFIVCSSQFWWSSYRLAYLRMNSEHLLLLSVLIMLAWLFISYAVTRHRLFNRKLFVSRKVVYSATAPVIFGGYLLFLGIASLLIRAFGWSMPFVLQWLLVILGLTLVIVLALSQRVRSTVKYFVSTHFYVNKYEYRDEWLAFSNLLQGSLTEREVSDALRRILSESLYTSRILIWLGDLQDGFRLIDGDKNFEKKDVANIPCDDPLVLHLQDEPYFYLEKTADTPSWQKVSTEKNDFFISRGLVLVAPLSIGKQIVGLVGLGPEYTGGRYGFDDFDLLAALGSQAASAILAVRTAEKLARVRETSAWDTLSAFVLHDIKNAATMLNLVKQNAPAHINKPEFQQDMLNSVDDALKRMNKVQERLKTLKGDITPKVKTVEIGQFAQECCNNLTRKLPELTIDVQCRQNLEIQTDSQWIAQILENLLLNALEAGGPGTRVQVKVTNSDHQTVQLEIEDNGPGIPSEMLTGRLFEPFKTSKPTGSGIGLWQAKRLAERLDGTIGAENVEGGGAKFIICLPIR